MTISYTDSHGEWTSSNNHARFLGEDLQTDDSGKAFGLVIGAGLCTCIGAAAVFFPRLVKLANHKVLAASLGLAAGVMLYVSLVDIYGKAQDGFGDAGHDEDDAFIYTTLAFFGGLIIMKALNGVIKKLMEIEGSEMLDDVDGAEALDKIHLEAGRRQEEHANDSTDKPENDLTDVNSDGYSDAVVDQPKKLMSMAVATAVAIALHNFPEGLVTFVAYVEDPAVGIALASGIAIHNIPEGLCVAMPIFYATGSRWKGFWWALLSGISEPLGALVGWVVLKQSFSGNTYGILFGLVAGIMVYIAIDELLPTALKHDPTFAVTTPAVFLGMFLLAASLMLFSV